MVTRVGKEGVTINGEGPVTGIVTWFDPNWETEGLLLESIEITFPAPIPGVEGLREIPGIMTADGEGAYPFSIRATDAGPPGEGLDSITLAFGNHTEVGEGDFGYSSGPLVGGNLRVVFPDKFVEKETTT